MAEMVAVVGLTELQADLKKLGDGSDKMVRDASKAGAEVVAVEARIIVPELTGRLKRSIKANATAKAAFVKAGGGLPYAAPIHFGWRRHNIEPNPFLYKASDSRREEVVRTFEKELDKHIVKVIVRG